MAAFIGHSQTIPTGATAIPLWCESCGESVGIVMPASMRSLGAMIHAFEDAHCECASRCACDANGDACQVHRGDADVG